VVAVVAATLVGAALTALVLLSRASADSGSSATNGSAAGLRMPSTSTSTLTATAGAAGADPSTAAAPDPGPAVRASAATASPGSADPAAFPPTRVVVPRLGVDMPVEPQGVDGAGQMGLPLDPGVAGWYRFGSAPGDAHGAVVVAAHIDSRRFGVGPFFRLGSAQVGDEIRVTAGDVTWVYRVAQVARVDKAELDADGLFALSGPPRLHLVTCTGDYVNGTGYRQNLVVVADRVGP